MIAIRHRQLPLQADIKEPGRRIHERQPRHAVPIPRAHDHHRFIHIAPRLEPSVACNVSSSIPRLPTVAKGGGCGFANGKGSGGRHLMVGHRDPLQNRPADQPPVCSPRSAKPSSGMQTP